MTRTRYSLALGCGMGTWVGLRVDGSETKDLTRIACIVDIVFAVFWLDVCPALLYKLSVLML